MHQRFDIAMWASMLTSSIIKVSCRVQSTSHVDVAEVWVGKSQGWPRTLACPRPAAAGMVS